MSSDLCASLWSFPEKDPVKVEKLNLGEVRHATCDGLKKVWTDPAAAAAALPKRHWDGFHFFCEDLD